MQAANMKKAVNSTVAACVMSVVRRNPETGNLAIGREDELRTQRRRAERRPVDPDTGAVLYPLLDEVERGELAVLAHHLRPLLDAIRQQEGLEGRCQPLRVGLALRRMDEDV